MGNLPAVFEEKSNIEKIESTTSDELIKMINYYEKESNRLEGVLRTSGKNQIKKRISTSHIERQNLTMRMNMRRLTRLTNAFSQKLENHKAAIALHFFHYSFMRIHSSLRVTPAMQANVTNKIWNWSDLLNSNAVRKAA